MTVLVRLKLWLMSEDWLVTVERRVDMKLLLKERSSRGRTHNRAPRQGMYLARANLGTETVKGGH